MYEIRREKVYNQSRNSSWTSKLFALIFILSFTIYYYYNKDYILSLADEYLPTKKSISLGIALYYGKILFSIIIIASIYTWLINSKIIRFLLIFILFIVYLFYWYSSLFIYPYRILLLIAFSLFFYGTIHFYMFFRMKKELK
jgi:hypothetical protein